MALILSAISVLSIIFAEIYLSILTKLISNLGIKADFPRQFVALLFFGLLGGLSFVSLEIITRLGMREKLGMLFLIPLWNFGCYVILNWKRAKHALGPIKTFE
jgi:amino acid permease